MNIYDRLAAQDLEIKEKIPKGGTYSPIRYFGGNLAYVSGTGPVGSAYTYGKLGAEYSLEQGREAARCTMHNIISNLHHELGDLNRIKSFVKILAFVASADGFYDQPQVINGASELLAEVFGEEIGMPARSAIGVNALPSNIPVEIELLLELKDEGK